MTSHPSDRPVSALRTRMIEDMTVRGFNGNTRSNYIRNGIERVRPLEEARKRLTMLAVADETKAGVRRDFVRDAAHNAAPAAEREVLRFLSHKT